MLVTRQPILRRFWHAVLPLDRLATRERQEDLLATTGEMEVRCRPDEARMLRRALLRAAATPVEAGVLLHYARVDGIHRDHAGLRARLVLDLVGE